jgi:N-acetylglucosamine kinase-like BadF-type ATPase
MSPLLPQYFLGIDAGGTKTHALIADASGRALGFGSAGAGNWQRVGFDGQPAVLRAAMDAALAMAGLRVADLTAAGLGMAGFDWPSQLAAHQQSAAAAGISCPAGIVNDAIIGLLAGAAQGWGVVLVAGTGNNVRGRDRHGREGRITGEGMRFGEFGGGGELVMKAVHAVAYEWSRRGPHTAVSDLLMATTGASDLESLLEGIDTGRYVQDAAWALAVFQAAYAGDAVAREVIAWSARELGESACAVIRQLDLQHETFEVVQIGSLFEGGALYVDPLCETIRALAPGARFVRLRVPPVIGGVALAMQTAGITSVAPRERLIESTAALMGPAAQPDEDR